jgi:hypothetical protein
MELNQSTIEELARSSVVLRQIFEDKARADIVANAVRLLNEALLLDRSAVSALVKGFELTSPDFLNDREFIVSEWDWPGEPKSSMSVLGLINSLLGFGLSGGSGIMIDESPDGKIIRFRVRAS